MASLFSTLATAAGQLTRPVPDHGAIDAALGHASASNRAVTSAALVNAAAHSPTVVAFQLNNDPYNIYIGYHPTLFPADLHAATACDNGVHVMVGDDIESAMGLVLQVDAFGRVGNMGHRTRDYILGANGCGEVGGVNMDFQIAAAGSGNADTDECLCGPTRHCVQNRSHYRCRWRHWPPSFQHPDHRA